MARIEDMPKRLLLVGGGGHCRSVLDSLLTLGIYEAISIVDPDPTASAQGIGVVGVDADLPRLRTQGWTHAFVTVGSVGNTRLRRKLYQIIVDCGYSVPTVVDRSAVLARDVRLSEGVFVGKRAVLNAGSQIGMGAIVNTGAIVEHDCVVGDFAHISPGAVLCGGVQVGDDAHIGAGAVLRQGISVGKRALIGAGSVVVRDMPEDVTAYGVPCREVE
jgi:sugar O-acyltransferase (sialic acid O-acetyltransferase NeuD family)